MRDVAIVTAIRTPVGRGIKGVFKDTRPDDLAAAAIRGAVERTPGLEPAEIDDVILGCAIPEAEQGMNVARVASMIAELPNEVSAMTVNRFCASGLQAIAIGAQRIAADDADIVLAGGVESMSAVPMTGGKPAPNPDLMERYPESFTGMGTPPRWWPPALMSTGRIKINLRSRVMLGRWRPWRPGASPTRSFP